MTSPYITGSVVESAVGLVLVKTGEQCNAMTVSMFSEVAHHPTALWVAISPETYTHSMIEQSKRFALVVLNQRQGEIALNCGSVSGREQDKCAALNLYESEKNFLFLKGALASTGCTVSHSHKVGDHTIFVADIVEAELDTRMAHLRQLLLSDLRA
jgi:flavin reductase (DIM6/NTAB) family NADH-FMN oxidoreductase RutF